MRLQDIGQFKGDCKDVEEFLPWLTPSGGDGFCCINMYQYIMLVSY